MATADSANPRIKSPRRSRITISVEGPESNSDSDDENSSESSSSSSEEEEEEEEGGGEKVETNSRLRASPQKRSRGRHKDDSLPVPAKERISKSSRRPRPQSKARRRPSSSMGTSRSNQSSRPKRKSTTLLRTRLDSGGAYSSTSEAEFPVNGTSRPHPHLPRDGSRDVGRIMREESKCSSVYETANEGYLSIDEKTMTSPQSDAAAATGAPRGIPKATGIESLTARNLTVPRQSNARGKKRKRSTGVSDRGKKKSRIESGSSADGGQVSKSKTINGLVNGSGACMEINPLDLVWAKCRGYPPYPALVSI